MALTSLDNVGNASPAPAAAALSARLSGGLLQLSGYTKCVCPPTPPPVQTRHTCGPSHGRQAADQGHVCICVLVANIISLWGPAVGVAFSY